MTYDLHCHSHFSDGKHTPEFLIERARQNGVTQLAITDHDCTDAHGFAGHIEGVEVIAGVEISCNWQNIEIHIVGLTIDAEHESLQQLMLEQQAKRRNRISAIDDKLRAAGVTGLQEYLAELEATAWTRSHVADFLVAKQFVRTREKAFKKYLGKNARAYVKADWCSMQDAISAIGEAGGLATLAHPSRYPINRGKQKALISAFADAGGTALECCYPNLSVDHQNNLLEAAHRHNLYLSTGSDFHDAAATWTDVGRFAPLEDKLHARAIWNHPDWPA